jgi:hypothetical protein
MNDKRPAFGLAWGAIFLTQVAAAGCWLTLMSGGFPVLLSVAQPRAPVPRSALGCDEALQRQRPSWRGGARDPDVVEAAGAGQRFAGRQVQTQLPQAALPRGQGR